MRSAILGFAAAALCAAGPAMAQDFPDKQTVLEQLRFSTVGDMVVRRSDPSQESTTFTSTNSYRGGFSTSTSRTYDSTPRPRGQIIRIANPTIYDIKNLSIECVYFAESGTPVSKNSQTFLKFFRTGLMVEVIMKTPLAAEADYVLCGPRDFDYVGVGVPPPPSPPRSAEPSIANGTAKPVVDEWGVPRRSKTY
jgi:hypothetical protein